VNTHSAPQFSMNGITGDVCNQWVATPVTGLCDIVYKMNWADATSQCGFTKTVNGTGLGSGDVYTSVIVLNFTENVVLSIPQNEFN